MNKTKAPIKYLMATSVLKLTESDDFNRSMKQEPNVFYILKVLQSNLKSLDQSQDENFDNDKIGHIPVQELNEEDKEDAEGEGNFTSVG